MKAVDLDTIAEELYGLLPEEFTAARTAREKEAKGSGDKDLAGQIHTLAKPNQVAWLANQLARQHAEELRPLLDLGAGLRDAAGSLTGDQLREFTKQKRQLTAALVQQARRIASRAGRKVSDDAARGLQETLDAGLADPDCAQRLLAGRLTSGLQHSGFGAMSGGVPTDSRNAASPRPAEMRLSARSATRISQDERRTQRLAAADTALEDAEAAAEEVRRARDEARAEMQQAEDAATEASYDIERLQVELERATAERTRAEREHRRLEKVVQRADAAASGADRRTVKAREDRQRILDQQA